MYTSNVNSATVTRRENKTTEKRDKELKETNFVFRYFLKQSTDYSEPEKNNEQRRE